LKVDVAREARDAFAAHGMPSLAPTGHAGDGSQFAPIRVIDLELARPIAAILPQRAENASIYTRALCLVRLHTRPMGLLNLALEQGGMGALQLAQAVWHALSDAIQDHLRADGLPPATELGIQGLPPASQPVCVRRRLEFCQSSPSASVIVCTRDRPHMVAPCLHALQQMHYPDYEVIVVDNAPQTDGVADLLQRESAHDSRLRYVREDCPGLGAARNRGLTAARGEIVAYTDDDVRVDGNWLAEIVRACALTPQTAAATGLILPYEIESAAQLWFEQYGGFGRGFAQRIYDQAAHRPQDPLFPYRASIFGAGANMAFRTDYLREMGGFDPALGPGTRSGGGDDLEAYFRVITAGGQIVYEPAAIVFHMHRREYPALQYQLYTCGMGLTAYLTQALLRQPALVPDLLRRLPKAVQTTLRRREQYARPESDYPRELDRIWLRGLFAGPLAYLRSRRCMRRLMA
jgi:O-antigen biosynthesis protein